ncbi:DUF1349 domain-containing protein [Paenibacillus nasutitermitis]|uniref:DUF1349 domain-containing protein n=1 Tax=Paenibacillus nasutitermitis TaxID=1652958 RepID=A0A917DKN6_9BACL|nr:DUF1349 domain-containing protein [Paenibacillus nasutitermitis]GGD46512.1 hypothetical protein GCM10010911_00010 [Paenibacillus nasutitermitis]
MNLFEKCSGRILPDRMEWINEPEEWHFNESSHLKVYASSGADFFIDPAGGHAQFSAPFLYTRIKGEFVMSTRIKVDMKKQYDSGCLMLMADAQNWAKLCFEFFDDQPSIISVVTKNTSDDCVSAPLTVTQPYIRIARGGNCFAFHYSVDGVQWHLVRYFGMEGTTELKVGVVTQSPVGEGCLAEFEYLNIIEQPAEGDIRKA